MIEEFFFRPFFVWSNLFSLPIYTFMIFFFLYLLSGKHNTFLEGDD